MKRILLAITFLTIATISFAQTVRYGIEAGINLSRLSVVNSSTLTGYRAGAIVDIGFENFSIQPGIFYTTKGDKITDVTTDLGSGMTSTSAYITKLTYLELPVNFLYKIKLHKDFLLNLGGGPYVAYGISAHESVDNNNYPASFSSNSYYRNPDLGINFTAETELHKRYIIQALYGLGLTEVMYHNQVKNRVLNFSVGYLF